MVLSSARRSAFLYRPSSLQMRQIASQLSVSAARANIAAREEGPAGVHAFSFLASNDTASPGTGPLQGLPIAVKDAFNVRGWPTTACSDVLADFIAPYTATPVALLQAAGAQLIGKTAHDEFSMGASSTNLPSSFALPPANPWCPSGVAWEERELRSCGGSSGGSAGAVAAGMAWAALGTDTGGSTRLPASYCGIAGFKPTYGMISRWGLIAYADTLDTVGIMASDVESVEKVYDVIAQPDHKDPTSISPSLRSTAEMQAQQFIASLPLDGSASLAGLRIGIPLESFPSPLTPASLAPFRALLASLRARGATLHSVSTPLAPHALSAYYVIACAEASSNLARFDGVKWGMRGAGGSGTFKNVAESTRALFGEEVRKRILVGAYSLSAEAFDSFYLPSLKLRQLLTESTLALFRHGSPFHASAKPPSERGVDVLLSPTTTTSATPLAGSAAEGYAQDVLSVGANLTGFPALSVSLGPGEDGWPVGVTITGVWGADAVVLRVGKEIERSVKQADAM